MSKQEKLDRAWLRAALSFGSTLSHDPECKLGACVVSPDNLQVSFGYNGLPKAVPDTVANWGDKGIKNALVIHAEVNAIINAPFPTSGTTLYVTRKLCHRCFGVAINAGCRRIVHLADMAPWKYEDKDAFGILERTSGVVLVELEWTTIELQMAGIFQYTKAENT